MSFRTREQSWKKPAEPSRNYKSGQRANPYSGYADWVRNSNSAARFREAFALADQMDPPLKMACVENLHRLSTLEWEAVQEMGSALSSQERA